MTGWCHAYGRIAFFDDQAAVRSTIGNIEELTLEYTRFPFSAKR